MYKHLVQKKCPLSVVGRVRYIEKYFKDFMKEKFRSIKICPLWASVRLSRVSVRTGFPVVFFIKITPRFLSTVLSANEWPYYSTGPVWKLRIDQVNDMHYDFLSGVYCASEMEGWTPGQNRPISQSTRKFIFFTGQWVW